ncbi:murein DD-endopeptidase MepM/ murein hydrolase activator NlpD [Myceligenerans xiligouense]|uniref:Murein DD-endopeptidase MepM/ murein hydrolase activator NlpD n=2 Tax=Myceligenerans xiligouense TaxID=253184 RepID=A0A3N4ZRP9_9MICO|nr:murein DD-endopeptidase MepM/ murein hydrolase activator NlpD [Myceligenerans xiligouense]
MMPHRTTARVVPVAFALLLALGGATAVVPAAADDLDDQRAAAEAQADAKQREREELESSLEHTDEKLAAAALELNQVEARLPIAEADLAQAEAGLEQAEREAAILAQRLTDAQSEEARIVRQIADDAGKADTAREDIVQMAREDFRSSGTTTALGLVTGAQTTEEFLDGYAVSSSAARSQARALAELQDSAAQARNMKARLTAIRETVALLKKLADENVEHKKRVQEEAAAKKAEIENLVAEQRSLTNRIERRKAAATRSLEQTEQAISSIEADLKELIAEQQERDRQRAASRSGRDSGGTGGGGSSGGSTGTASYLSWPTANPVVTSPYGMRYHPVLNYWRLHAGTDFRAYCGTPILAANSGTVVYARTIQGLGNQVLVDHGYTSSGNSLMSSYNHLTSWAVSPGQRVTRGQVVGYSGTTGTSTACHLHFEVYVNGSTVDPMSYL